MERLRKIFAGVLSFVLVITALPVNFISVNADDASEKFPYMIFASACENDAIKFDVQNGCLNGSIGANGTIALNGNMNINGTKTENAGQAMIIALNKLNYRYFSNDDVQMVLSDYDCEDANINIGSSLSVSGNACFTGNINQNGAVMAAGDIVMHGKTVNVTDSVICSEAGSISIDGTCVSVSGLIYAPYGEVRITAQTVNLNNVVVIAEKVTLQSDVLNANYNDKMAELIGTETEVELRLWSFGTYLSDRGSILIKWMSTVPEGTFEVLVSDDNEDYTSIGTSADGQEFEYAGFEEFDRKYIRVMETTYYGETVSAVPLVAVKTEEGYEIQYLDTDEDGIPDILEEQIGTDCLKADTDGDGLTDYQEIYITDTDPLVFDSVEPGVSDADADSDADGISNIDETRYGTDPLCADTDGDGISDYDELYIYGTNPLKADTDDDGINDGDELKLGLDPENPRTFGVADPEYKMEQKISADSAALSDINTDGSPYMLSIDITAAGYVEGDLQAHETSYAKIIQNEAMLGIASELIYTNEESIEEVVLRFEISEEYIDNTLNLYPEEEELTGIKRLNVFKYFEDLNMLLPVETKFDVENNILYAEVDELGTYCVMDLEVWLNSFAPLGEDNQEEAVPVLMSLEQGSEAEDDSRMKCAGEVNVENEDVCSESIQNIPMLMSLKTSALETPLDVVFILQTAGTSESYYELQRQMIKDVSDRLFETYSDVRICVIQYKENNADIVGSYTYPIWQTGAAYMSTILDKLTYEATSAYCNRGAAFSLMLGNIDFRENAGKFVFQIMNGNTSVGSGYFSQLDVCARCDINYSEISPSGWHYIDSSYEAKVESAIAATNGLNLTFSSQTAETVYNHIVEHLAPPQLSYVVKLPANYKEIHLHGVLDPDNQVNSDEDSLTDWKEVDTTKISWGGEGEIILPTLQECMGYTEKLYAVNGLLRITEKMFIDGIPMSEFEKRMNDALNNIPLLPILSNPCDADTDGDGLNDDVDANPMHVFDQRFINTAEKEDILTNYYIDETMAAADASYNTMPLAAKFFGQRRLDGMYMMTLFNAVAGGFAQMPDAQRFLLHFLGNTGEEYIYDASYVFCDIMDTRKNICKNINAILNLCEDTVIKELYFISNPEEQFSGAAFSNNAVIGGDMSVTNWWFSIGNTDATMSFHCVKEGDTYTAEIDYHFVDVYDFNKDSRTLGGFLITDGDMHELHEAGEAREYKSIGNYSFKITWTEGERIDENFSIEENEIHLGY